MFPELSVPLLPDKDYLSFLQENISHIHSVYFSLYTPGLPDARYRFEHHEKEEIQSMVSSLKGVKKYGLVNTRFFHPGTYLDKHFLWEKGEFLLYLYQTAGLTGIVFSDMYFLFAISRAHPVMAKHLCALPSVNFMIDTPDKLHRVFEMIGSTCFQLPDKITLDRSLNRTYKMLDTLVQYIRKHYPAIRIELLANEGCLFHCPFKWAHDSLIAVTYMGIPCDTHKMSIETGCLDRVMQAPEEIFMSPVIRPEDVSLYAGVADIFKISGRTLGMDFLLPVIKAYIDQRYKGNLLCLLDTMHALSHCLYVDNNALPRDLHPRVRDCSRDCTSCGLCRELAKIHLEKLPPGIEKMKKEPFP